jgi:hypothetical protein
MTSISEKSNLTAQPRLAQLGWRLEREQLIYPTGDDGVEREEQIIRFKPDMPWLQPGNSEWVLDFYELLRSAQTPDDYYLLTCSCGDSSDADIHESVQVTHPSANVIAWHLTWQSYDSFVSADVVRSEEALVLHFDRAQYELDLKAMWREIQCAHIDKPIYELQPGCYETLALLQAEISHAGPLPAVPLLAPPGELVFAMEGMGYCWLNGQMYDDGSHSLLPTRATHEAFRKWMSYVSRVYGLSPEGSNASWLVLKSEAGRAACDATGERLVAMLRETWAQSRPVVQVQVFFRPCSIAAAQP